MPVQVERDQGAHSGSGVTVIQPCKCHCSIPDTARPNLQADAFSEMRVSTVGLHFHKKFLFTSHIVMVVMQ